MRTLFYILVVFLLFLFISCQKDRYYNLSEEQKKQSLYYTYNEGDTLFFLKNNIDTTYCVISKKEHTYKFTKKLFVSNYVEIVKINMVDSNNNECSNIFISANDNSDGGMGIIDISFFELRVSRSNFDDIIDNFNIDSVIYYSVFEYKSSIVNTNLYANEEYGIINAFNQEVTYTKIK